MSATCCTYNILAAVVSANSAILEVASNLQPSCAGICLTEERQCMPWLGGCLCRQTTYSVQRRCRTTDAMPMLVQAKEQTTQCQVSVIAYTPQPSSVVCCCGCQLLHMTRVDKHSMVAAVCSFAAGEGDRLVLMTALILPCTHALLLLPLIFTTPFSSPSPPPHPRLSTPPA